jgi:hypothetical protein
MAFLACHQEVFAEQGESRHALMVECRLSPGDFGMAGLTLLAFLAFVLVVFLVTEEAVGLQFILIQVAFVTADTFRVFVFGHQWILGILVMIEQDLFPIAFNVASLALGSEVALVLVVLLVTCVATLVRYLVLIDIALMTAGTLGLFVFSQQRIFGLLVMIEQDFLPVALDVAAFALGSKTTLVLVILLVTRIAGGRLDLVLIEVTLMTAGTLGILVFSNQRVFGLLVMIEQDFLPVLFDVAGFTLGTEVTLVFVVLLMARVAVSLEFILEQIALMASITLRRFVFA